MEAGEDRDMQESCLNMGVIVGGYPTVMHYFGFSCVVSNLVNLMWLYS